MKERLAIVSIARPWEDPAIFQMAQDALARDLEVHLFMAVYPDSLPEWMDNRYFRFHPLLILPSQLKSRWSRFWLYFYIWHLLGNYSYRYGGFHVVQYYERGLIPAMFLRRLVAPIAARGSKTVYCTW